MDFGLGGDSGGALGIFEGWEGDDVFVGEDGGAGGDVVF